MICQCQTKNLHTNFQRKSEVHRNSTYHHLSLTWHQCGLPSYLAVMNSFPAHHLLRRLQRLMINEVKVRMLMISIASVSARFSLLLHPKITGCHRLTLWYVRSLTSSHLQTNREVESLCANVLCTLQSSISYYTQCEFPANGRELPFTFINNVRWVSLLGLNSCCSSR
jgi:hypothetical protein